MRLLPVLLCLLLATPATAANLPIEPLVDATVRIERHGALSSSRCTGTLVAPDLVITASHCLRSDGVNRLQFFDIDGNAHTGIELVARGALFTENKKPAGQTWADDWALVRVTPFDRTPLPIADLPPDRIVSAATEGGLVEIASYSGKKLHAVEPCALRARAFDGFFGVTCDVTPGDSGSPVVLMTPDGPRLIGLISGYNDTGSYAVSATQFAHLIAP